MQLPSNGSKLQTDDEFDEFSSAIELAELAARAHSLQHGSPLQLAHFLFRLNHSHFADEKERSELDDATEVFLETIIDW